MTVTETKPAMPRALPKKLKPSERIDAVLVSWDAVTTYLKELTAEQILIAIKREQSRESGKRVNILFRLAQRYDALTKSERINRLIG